MIVLHHFPLCPFSRQARVVLREKALSCKLVNEDYWEQPRSLLYLNPAGQVPVLVDNKTIVSEINAILEYLDEKYRTTRLLSDSPEENAEIRRIIGWFNGKFYNEVTRYILNEKVVRYFTKSGTPSSEYIRAAKSNLNYHLDYIDFLLNKNKWLAGNKLTFADIVAACQLSVLDYLGDVPWDRNLAPREWYSVIKSRPSFRDILNDKISGFNPSPHYNVLDF